MCDTFVALGSATASGHTLFAKSSDREPDEAQGVVYVPPRESPPGAFVQTTYRPVPDVRRTHGVLLCKPFWMWGAEMGVNDRGVAIGNEAIFTRIPVAREGLLGMDMLRLALERAGTAAEAVEVLTSLLGEHGLGGSAGYRHKGFRYDNGFLVADAREAFVLETAGREWAAEPVRGVRAISNGPTIAGLPDWRSPGLVGQAVSRRLCRGERDFHFARTYADPLYTAFGGSRVRRCRATALLRAREGSLTPRDLVAILRDHGEHADPRTFRPEAGLRFHLCAHASYGPIRGSAQSVGSLVAELGDGAPRVWVTGTSAPCTGLFKPLRVPQDAAEGRELTRILGPAPSGDPTDTHPFWLHERLHRATLLDYPTRIALYRASRDAQEAPHFDESVDGDWLARADRAHREAAEATASYTAHVQRAPVREAAPWAYRRFWGIGA